MSNSEKKELVLARLPLHDGNRIQVYGFKPKPTTSRKYSGNHAPVIDVTRQVKQLLQEGKLKRIRKYGYGHSGHAGHTLLVCAKK